MKKARKQLAWPMLKQQQNNPENDLNILKFSFCSNLTCADSFGNIGTALAFCGRPRFLGEFISSQIL